MIRYLLIAMLIAFSLAVCSAVSENPQKLRMYDTGEEQNSCGMQLGLTNYGVIGSELIIPSGGNANYLYTGSLWLGGKKFRRNAAGMQLYWVAQNPSADSSGVIAEGEPGWNEMMRPVVDTLTSQGFDGDKNLFELLPAYNPLMSYQPNLQDLYSQYNSLDKVLKSIQSYPSPLPFLYPDPEETYCYSIPQDVVGNEPGFETNTAFYYDKCPFETPGQRDYGTYASSSTHVPLGLAIEQKSYAWPVQTFEKMAVFKYKIVNMSEVDTLYDVCLSYYLDCDIGPITGGSSNAVDDLSGYVMGDGYEFAYSKDNNGDNGLAPYLIGCKFYVPDFELNKSCYTWRVGDGPDDFNPQSLNLGTRITANEKYWLMTGRNPKPYNLSIYQTLRGGPSGSQEEYIQTIANDTRFLYSYYGNLPTSADPNPPNRINLPPHHTLSAYMVLFADSTLIGLKNKSLQIEDLISNNLNVGSMTGQITFPYITRVNQVSPGAVNISWFNFNSPSSYTVKYKLINSVQWQTIQLPGSAESIHVTGLNNLSTYRFIVGALYNTGSEEVYVESQPFDRRIDNSNTNEDETEVVCSLTIYPNPFKPGFGTTIRFPDEVIGDITLDIYNAKGQKVKTFTSDQVKDAHGSTSWSGKDDNGRILANGVYYCKLTSGKQSAVDKILLIK